jgi:outer membrane protein insertion porin family
VNWSCFTKKIILSLLIFSSCVLVQAQQDENEIILQVTSPSFDKESLERIQRLTGLYPGRTIDRKKINDAIQTLNEEGKIQSLFVEGTQTSKGWIISVRGNRLRKLRDLKFVDVDSEIADEAKSKLGLKTGQAIDLSSMSSLREILKSAYEARGYYFADVQIVLNDVPSSQDADLVVTVRKNQPTLISAVILVGGNREQNRTLSELVSLKKGKIFSKASLDTSVEGINKYLRANQYPTSKVDGTNLNFNQDKSEVAVTILVRWNERLQFVFSGNRVYGSVAMRDLITEEVLAQADANLKLAQVIEEKYRRVGYHFCRVRSEITHREREKLTVVHVRIHEGPKVIIDNVDFGPKAVKNKSELENVFFENAPGVLNRHIYWEEGLVEASNNLRSWLETEGYLSASVPPPRSIFTDDKRGVLLLFDLEAGTRTLVLKYEFDGNQNFSKEILLKEMPLKESDPFNKQKLIDGRKNLLAFYQAHGFLDAKFEGAQENLGVTLNRDQKDAVIRVNLNEGPQYRVGDVTIEGNKKTLPKIIFQEMKVKKGDVYDPNLVRKSEDGVALLGLYQKVEILPSTSAGSPYVKDLKIVVKENKPGVGELGLGLDYEDPRFRIRPFTGIAYRNLMGLNQTANARAEVSLPLSAGDELIPFVEYSFMLGYRVPNPFDFPVIFTAQAGADAFEVAVQGPELLYRTHVDGKVEKKISRNLTLIYRIYHFERSTIDTIGDLDTNGLPNPAIIPGVIRESIGSTGPGMILDFRDDIFNPSRGSYHTLDFEFATPLLLSQDNISFWMTTSRNSFYIPLFHPFSFKFYVGAAYAQSIFPAPSVLPLARLVNDLSLGGTTSIRGYTIGYFQPILPGPVYPQQAAFWNGRFELISELFTNVSGAIFMDTGQIYINLIPQGQIYGVGFGFRYKTPVGPIVIDIAEGIGSQSVGVQFYFTVGTI